MASTEETPSLETQQTTVVGKKQRGRQSSRRSTNKQHRPQPGKIQFINTIHPDESTSKHSLTIIRSHVARHSRALQRERKQHHNQQSRSLPKIYSASQPICSRAQIRQHHEEEEEDEDTHDILTPWNAHKRFVMKTGDRALAPKPKELGLLPRSTSWRNTDDSNPIQMIGGSRKDCYQGFARPLSDEEDYLFDFYMNYVILNGYKACHHKEDDAVFTASMREIWVPFMMTQPCLMAAAFHVACRNYAANTSNDNTRKFSIKKLQYRLTCLSMAKDAIATQAVANDATIALALIMASESVCDALTSSPRCGSGKLRRQQ
ncbi:hypothetical protein BGZ61DRAFT_497132 [Ilyonectria robusta]|uniref:uncharacterized protein n=1 Tax=Ilyonectria robusta TaxID=1079257 RepID=UPI001E8E9AA5|nr:uncharacterized protein BGZ61DRAFT_497132 [Ilyonectria robusta]KAH8675235.1 hypothetical protein BGZ61DRAFT_497132 [Ilyonectria robusta]